MPGGRAAYDGAQSELQDRLSGYDVARYLDDVTVERHKTFLGEQVTKISGTIGAEDLLNQILGRLGGLPGSGLDATSLADLYGTVELGDIRAAVYVSEADDLVRAVHLEFVLTGEGQTAAFEVDLALQSVNEPVEIPAPAVTA
jgi:hypothetical protein